MKALSDQVASQPTEQQLLYALGEQHTPYRPLDGKNMIYMDKVAEILKKNEQNGKDVQLLIEAANLLVPSEPDQDADLLYSLTQSIEKLKLTKTKLENIEIRKFCKFASETFEASDIHLLCIDDSIRSDWETNPEMEKVESSIEFQKKVYEKYGCRYEEITFAHALNELDELLSKATEMAKKWHGLPIHKEYLVYVENAREYIQILKDKLVKYNIDQSSSIFKTSLALAMEDLKKEKDSTDQPNNETSKRESLRLLFLGAGSDLFNAALLDRILELRKTPEKQILIISGVDHVALVTTNLRTAGIFERLESHCSAASSVPGLDLPLPIDKVELLLKSLDYFQERFIWTDLKLKIGFVFKKIEFLFNFNLQANANEPVKKP